uniref:Peptidase S1 domain-containing protein n=1 Tax=Mola mola TaxID=94237 RepID=A0A3Q3XDJ6_MOLML
MNVAKKKKTFVIFSRKNKEELLELLIVAPSYQGQIKNYASDGFPPVCGIAPKNTKIVGGGTAAAGAWPWHVSIEINGFYTCGGTLINNQWILTAAHIPTSMLKVYLGRDALNYSNPNEQSRSVFRKIPHPQYSTTTFDNDIALLQLSSPVTFTDYIRPVCLAKSGSTFDAETSCWITGWGDIGNNDLHRPERLSSFVNVTVVSNIECDRVYGDVTSNHICTSSSRGGTGICVGDGGGPLLKKTDNKWVQAGVMSFVAFQGCALPNIPEGYTRVSNYQSWISSHFSSNPPGFVYSGAAHLVSLSVPLLLYISLLLLSVFNL